MTGKGHLRTGRSEGRREEGRASGFYHIPVFADSGQASSEIVTEESGHSSIALSGANAVTFAKSHMFMFCDRSRLKWWEGRFDATSGIRHPLSELQRHLL